MYKTRHKYSGTFVGSKLHLSPDTHGICVIMTRKPQRYIAARTCCDTTGKETVIFSSPKYTDIHRFQP